MNEIANNFIVVVQACCQELLSAKDDGLFASANVWAFQYPDDLSQELPIDLIYFRNVLRAGIEENARLN